MPSVTIVSSPCFGARHWQAVRARHMPATTGNGSVISAGRTIRPARSLMPSPPLRERLGAIRVVISAEDLFDMQTAHETEFSRELVEAGARRLARLAADFGYDVRIAVYLRRQDHLLAVHYAQYIKGSSVNDVDFDEFAEAFAPRLDSWSILTAWVAAFGPEHVRYAHTNGLPCQAES